MFLFFNPQFEIIPLCMYIQYGIYCICSVSEGLRILRQVQEEMRQMDSALAEIDTASNTSKQGEVAGGGIAV